MRLNDVSKQPTMGINVRSDGNLDYADMIVDGRKKYESRQTDSLRPYVGKTVAIIRTGRGQAEAIGQATVGEPIVVDAFKFDQMRRQHRVPAGSAFDIEVGAKKYLYPMIDPVRWDVPKPVKNKGIIARKVNESSNKHLSIKWITPAVDDKEGEDTLNGTSSWSKNTYGGADKLLYGEVFINGVKVARAIFGVHDDMLEIDKIWVADEYRRTGLASLLIKKAKEKTGITQLWAPHTTDDGGELMQSISKINESVGKVGNKLHDPAEYERALRGFRNYFGEREKAENELDGYSSGLDWLNKNGGKIYRVVFADSPEEVRIQDVNHHWTWDSSMLDYFIENLWSNYGAGKKHAYVIEATVPPMSLSNYGVDVQGNPEEQEVNIAANHGAITYKLFQKDGWKLTPLSEDTLNEYNLITHGYRYLTILNYLYQLLPTWPKYVVKDWLMQRFQKVAENNKIQYEKITKSEINHIIRMEMFAAGLSPNTKWQLVPNFNFKMNVFDKRTQRFLKHRLGGQEWNTWNDAERHAYQEKMLKKRGISQEPCIIIKHTDGYELVEGWHRTIQTMKMYPDGYAAPAWVAVSHDGDWASH